MLKKFRKFSKSHPARALVLGYLIYSLIGWMLLSLPICQTKSVRILDNFFTAVSAISTTGLATLDIGTEYSFLGQIAIFLLIQAGGLGYMTFSSFIVLATTRKLSSYREKMATNAFSLPHEFSVKEFIYHVAFFTFACELIGAVFLSIIFMHRGIENFIWNGVFHSVSAFCTAGFSLFIDDFMGYKYDLAINATLSILSILGAVGFIVWLDLYKRITGKKRFVTFITKVILFSTFSFLVIGTLLFSATEVSTAHLTLYERIITSFFQVMSASTTVGYNTLDIGSLSTANIILLLFLMVFGASPSGTGGGLKSTTFSALFSLAKCTLLNKDKISLLHREIPPKRIQLASASFAYYSFVMVTFVFLLVIVEHKPFLPVVFEAASALSTAGLSMGITSDLTQYGKLLISLLMLMGRVGILTFGIALSAKTNGVKEEYKKDNELVF